MNTKIFYSLILSLLTVACQSVSNTEITKEEEPQADVINLNTEQLKNLSLQLGDASSTIMGTTLRVQGKVDLPPQNLISVNFPLGGYLKQTKLIPGMKVSKGEVIATIEDQAIVQLQQDYLSARSKLELANMELSRQKIMADANAGVARNLQQAEAEARLQSISVRSLGEKLKLIGIDPLGLNEGNISGQVQLRSTINGYVSKVHVNTGKYIQPTETMFELIDPDDIHAALTLFEKDLPYVQKGDDVQIHFHDDRSAVFPAEVILVNRDVDDDRTAIAHCHFKRHPRNLLPGMYIEADITVKNAAVSVLPDEAIVRFGNAQHVFIRKDSVVFQMIPVMTGLSKEGRTEIVSGLESVAKGSIVLNNAYKLLGILKNSEEE